jgi:hypothetical protein
MLCDEIGTDKELATLYSGLDAIQKKILTARKVFLTGVAALLLATSAAHATEDFLACSAPEIFKGDVGKFPISAIAIWHDKDLRTWRILHFMSNNQIAEREKQYDIKESSTYILSQWRGILKKNPSITMVGEIQRDKETKNLVYYEWLYDNSGQAPKLEMHMGTFCEYPTTDGMPEWLTKDPPAVRVLPPR